MKYAFVNGIVLDGTKNMVPVTGKAVLVEDGKIKDIVENSGDFPDHEIVDLEGAYLLPGLIDLHVHIAIDGKPPKKEKKPTNYKLLFQVLSKSRVVLNVMKRRAAKYAETELLSGVTTIRTVGGILDIDGKCGGYERSPYPGGQYRCICTWRSLRGIDRDRSSNSRGSQTTCPSDRAHQSRPDQTDDHRRCHGCLGRRRTRCTAHVPGDR